LSYREYCDLCNEDFDDDNLTTCGGCGRWFCYRCGDCGAKRCSRCMGADRPADGDATKEPASAGAEYPVFPETADDEPRG
jgi:hypothetical protein